MNHLKLLFGSAVLAVLIACLPIASVAAQERKERLPRSFLTGALDVNRLTTTADLIVIGQVQSATDEKHAIAYLKIQNIVKGEASPDLLEIEFEPDVPTVNGPIEPSLFGLFFLNRNANGRYRFTDHNRPLLIVPSNASLTAQTPLDRVVSIIGEFIVKPAPIEYRRIAVYTLRWARSELSDKLLRQAAEDTDIVVRLQAIAALVDHGDLNAVALAEQILRNPPPQTDQHLLDNLTAALRDIRDIKNRR